MDGVVVPITAPECPRARARRHRGPTSVGPNIGEGNPARPHYERLGFVPAGGYFDVGTPVIGLWRGFLASSA